VTHSERPLSFHDFLSARSAPQTAPSVKTMVLAGALVVYALGFVALYPLAHASVSKSAAEGNDPALVGLAGP
jgi:biotin transporter BioY